MKKKGITDIGFTREAEKGARAPMGGVRSNKAAAQRQHEGTKSLDFVLVWFLVLRIEPQPQVC
jgi:hypothetical protein